VQQETLEDQLRRSTRNFTQRLPEEDVFRLGIDLAQELARAHEETPPRHPELEPSAIAMVAGKPKLEGGSATGDASNDIFELGALLTSLLSGAAPEVSWRLDGPPAPDASTLKRRSVLAALAAPRKTERLASAREASQTLESALAAASVGPSPWPLFRGDEGRTGARPGPSPATLAGAWDAPVGPVVASPVLAAGLVVVPCLDGRLVFVDAVSGRRIHEGRVGSAVESSPVVDDRTLHVGNDDGEIVGIDIASGRETYRTRVGGLVRSSPLLLDGRVIAGVVDAKGTGQAVALDAATGKVVWSRRLGAVFSSPARAGGHVLVGSDDGSLHALEPATGAVAWSHALGGKVRATPAVSGEIAIAADFDGRVVAVRIADGSRVWVQELGHTVYSSPSLASGLCVLGCHDGHIHGLSFDDGQPRFEVQTRGPVVASPIAAGERIIVGSTDGDLYLVDLAGSVLQRVRLSPEGIQSSSAFDGGGIVVGSGTGLHALRLQP
jgi:outer membrane protein assembly factor BamB